MTFIREFLEESKKQDRRQRCLHYHQGVRCDEFISAHSIQEAGQLALLQEQNHVYRLNANFSVLKKSGGLPQINKISIRKASTFSGFCKYHDNALFEPIDNYPLTPSRKLAALYAYRCLCREYFVKENAVNVLRHVRDYNDTSEYRTSLLKSAWAGHALGFERLTYHKSQFDESFNLQQFEEFEFIYFTARSKFNIQLSGVLYPDFDFAGRPLQDTSDLNSPLGLITVFSAPIDEGWAFGFCWHKSSNHVCIPLIQSLADQIAKGEHASDLLLRLSISCCENHAIRMSWWNNLDAKQKNTIMKRIIMMMHPEIAISPKYLAEGCEGIADWQFEYVHTSASHDRDNP